MKFCQNQSVPRGSLGLEDMAISNENMFCQKIFNLLTPLLPAPCHPPSSVITRHRIYTEAQLQSYRPSEFAKMDFASRQPLS